MSIYGQLDANKIVINTIFAEDSAIQYLNGDFVKSDEITGSCAIGSRYDESLNKFIYPQPYPSWTLDSSGVWQPPKPKPSSGISDWNEDSQEWIDLTPVNLEVSAPDSE